MSEEKELSLYEVGIHFIPSLSVEEAQAEHEKIVSRIEKEGGSVKMNQLPEERALAYEMSKEISGKKNYYTTSYFGYVVVEMPTSLSEIITKELGSSKVVLRSLVIRLPKEALITRERKIPTSHKEEPKRGDEKKDTGPIDEETIDKTIDELVLE